MANLLFQENAKFVVAKLLSETNTSAQVEDLRGKRSKIKQKDIWMRFETPLDGLLELALANFETLDIQFLWEAAPQQEFSFIELASHYYGRTPQVFENIAMAMKLYGAVTHFRRKGTGRFMPVTADILLAILAGQAKKARLLEQQAQMMDMLLAHSLPPTFQPHLPSLLHAPNKNSPEYKVLVEAAKQLQTTPLALLRDCGVIPCSHEFHWQAFASDYPAHNQPFVSFATLPLPSLEPSTVQVFSIDDASTTEIDDAFSVQVLGTGETRVGIHIAVPTLGFLAHSEEEQDALARLSTLYTPARKSTMLPDSVITQFSLDAGTTKPALSLYLTLDSAGAIIARESKLEQVQVLVNLRNEDLIPIFNPQPMAVTHDYAEALTVLYQLSLILQINRGQKPNPIQNEIVFGVEQERVYLYNRPRGAPLDSLVEALMIEANQHWAECLAKQGIPAIYRVQEDRKVMLAVRSASHQGLGVAHYAWFTSPLRRAIDIINQRQLISLLQGMPPVYTKSQLVGLIPVVEQTYSDYHKFERRLDAFWSLRYVQQENLSELEAVVLRENTVRLLHLPLVTKVANLPALAKGTSVCLAVGKIDLLTIDMQLTFLRVIAKLDTTINEELTVVE